MKGLKVLPHLTILSTILVSSSIFAECSAPTGYYIEGNIGGTKLYGQSYPTGVSTSSGGKAWNISGGYKFTPFVGFEGGFSRYAPTRIKIPSLATGNLAQVQHVVYDLAAKFMYPIAAVPGLEPFGKLGGAYLQTYTNHVLPAAQPFVSGGTKTAKGLYWAAGLAYYFTPNLAVNAQYAQARGNSTTGTPAEYTVGLTFLAG